MFQLCLHLLLFITVISQSSNQRKRCREVQRVDEFSNTYYHAYCMNYDFKLLENLNINTTKLSVSGNSVANLTDAPFRNLSKIRTLSLESNKIRLIGNDAFEGLNQLEELILKNNYIKTIDEDVFKWCPLLKSIDFSANFVIRLTSFTKAMASLQQLKSVSFVENVLLQTVGEDDLKPLNRTMISDFDLQQCQLRTISKGAFSHLKHLKRLLLSTNPLPDDQVANALYNISTELDELAIHSMTYTEIPTKSLEALSKTKIKILNMKNNRFRVIYPGTIPRVPTLLHLNLRQCDIETFEGLVFANLTSLEKLDLSYNRIQSIPFALTTIKTLKYLDLTSNQDHRTPNVRFNLGKKVLGHLLNLEVLYLTEVRIDLLDRNNLYGLTNLKELYLNSALNDIEEFSFETLHNLEKLSLSGCLITSTPYNLFKGLGNLTHLILEATELSLQPNALHFHHTPNLNILNLRRNKITLMPHTDIKILKKLELLLLRNNAIIPWHDSFTDGQNVSLKHIDLIENNIDQVTPAMIRDFSYLSSIDISLNPYNCSKCGMYEFAKWLNSTQVKTINKLYIKCTNPKESRDKSVLLTPLYDYCINDPLPKIIAISSSISVIFVLFIIGTIVGYRFRWYFRYYWFLTRARVKKMKSISAADKFQYDAFISYNSLDQDWLVTNLLPKLEAEEPKFNVCLHERDFIIGKEIISNVVESIDNSRNIVLLLSNNFLKSQWCTWEMNMAQFMLVDGCRDALILIMLEPIKRKKMSSTLKYLIKTRTYLEWTDNVQGQKLFYERLKFALQRPVYENHQPRLI